MADTLGKLGFSLCFIIECMKCSKDSVDACKKLLIRGADVNFKSDLHDANTPLHIAIERQNIEWVRFLIAEGASSTIVNGNGKSAEDAVAETNNPEMVNALNRFKKIDEKYFAVVDYAKAISGSIPKYSNETKILKIKNCSLICNAKCLLASDAFLNAIKNSQVFVLVLGIDDFENEEKIRELLTRSFKRLMIVQFHAKNKSCWYFNNYKGNFKKLDIDRNSYLEKLKSNTDKKKKKTSYFELLCNLLSFSDGFYGRFEDDLMKIEIDLHKKFKNLTLIDNAVARCDLLTLKFLNLFNLIFSCKVNSEIVKKAIHYGNLEDLKLTLGFPLPRRSNVKKLELNRFVEGEYLILAAQSGQLQIVQFLLENNCNVDAANDSEKSAAACAFLDGNYEILHELLTADSPFPEDFNRTLEDQGFDDKYKFKELVFARTLFHKNIEENNTEGIREFIEENPKIKHAYTVDNQCALTTALIAKNFKIYSTLRSKGFSSGIDAIKCTQTLKTLDEYEQHDVKIYNRKHFQGSHSIHLQDLIARSHLGFGSGQENFIKIRKYFIKLDEISEIQPILKVVANSDKVKIVFDFKDNSVSDMDPSQISDHIIVRGRTLYTSDNILIGAKGTENEVLGTLAHELTHLAVHILYNNNGQPYAEGNFVQKEDFEAIAKITHSVRKECGIIENAFDYPEVEYHSELIVRVPQICATFENNPEELVRLKNIFSDLFQYFENTILKDCVAKFPVMKSEHKIESLNEILRAYSKSAAFDWFSTEDKLSLGDIFDVDSNLFIETNYPKLLLASIIKSHNDALMLERSHLFVEANQLLHEKYLERIKYAVHSEKNPKLFVVMADDLEFINIEPILKKLEITSKVVFISTVVPDIPKGFERKINVQYIWNDLCSVSKEKFMDEKINFQEKTVARSELMSSTDFLSALPIKDILDLKNWTVQLKIDRHQDFYIEKDFCRVLNNRDVTLSTDDVFDEMFLKKIIILADEAGKGKTCAVNHLAQKIITKEAINWVVFIDLKKYTDFFLTNGKEPAEYLLSHDALLLKILGLSNLQSGLFRNFYDSKRVIFLVDGYDEISAVYSGFVLNFIKVLKASENLVLVATRGHLSGELTREFKVEAIHLQPFTSTEQIKFLVKYWSKNGSKNEKLLNTKAKLLLGKFYWSINSVNNFLGNPLMIMLLAEIFSDENPNQLQDPNHLDFNLFLLYNQFWKKKTSLLLKKESSAKSDIVDDIWQIDVLGIHQKYAIESYDLLKTLSESLKLPEVRQPFEKTCEIIRRIGLLTVHFSNNGQAILDKQFEWVHRTFEEFFVADFILDSILQQIDDSRYEVIYSMFVELLVNAHAAGVRKFMNDKLENEIFKNSKLPKKFFKHLSHTAHQNILYCLLAECQTKLASFVMNALTEKEIFNFLVIIDELGNRMLNVICSVPGVFSYLWPTITTFLIKKKYQKNILLLCSNSLHSNLISTVASCGNEPDFEAVVTVILELFSSLEVKKILIGCYPGFSRLLLHRALTFKQPELISRFWRRAVQSLFPNKEDQKDILLSKGVHNQKLLCEIHPTTKEGVSFILDTAKTLLTSEEIKACLIEGFDQPPNPIFSLKLSARFKHFDIFKMMCNFMETSLHPNQIKQVLQMRKEKHENILDACLLNGDVRVTETVFNMARKFFTKTELKRFLGYKDFHENEIQNFLHYSFLKFKQFKVICDTFKEIFEGDELKVFLSGKNNNQENALMEANRIDDPKNLFLLVKLAESCYRGDDILRLYCGPKTNSFLAALYNADIKMDRDMLFDILNTTEDFINAYKDKIMPYRVMGLGNPMKLINPEKVFHIVLNFGSCYLISQTIKFMQAILNVDQQRALLVERDCLRCNALGRALMNTNCSVVDLIWGLYIELFDKNDIIKILLHPSALNANIVEQAAVADRQFLITALKYLSVNFSKLESTVFATRNGLNINHFVAKGCGEAIMAEYFKLVIDVIGKEAFRIIISSKKQNKTSILFYMLGNQSIECFKLFWSEISKFLGENELEKLIFEDTKNLQMNLFNFDTNLDSLCELNKIVLELFGKDKLDQRFEYKDLPQLPESNISFSFVFKNDVEDSKANHY